MAETPQFMHGCTKCVFLGRYELHDLYFCENHKGAGASSFTLIARFDHDDGDCKTSPGEAASDRHLHEAYVRAKGRQLVTQGRLQVTPAMNDEQTDRQWDELLDHHERFGKGSF
jgi:hypothetical protein